MNFDCDFLVERKDIGDIKNDLPIKMMFWVDSDLEGVWADDLNLQSSSPCSLFRIQTKILPLPSCTLNKRTVNSHTTIKNDSVKIQFFTDPQRETNMPDFQFMSACPIYFFFTYEKFNLGLWNYNIDSCDETGDSIPNYLLTVFNRNAMTEIPSNISLINPKNVPSKQYHMQIKKISNWIKSTLETIFPQEQTIFKTLRTYCRGPWMNTFFFDLHKLYETRDGTNLPPVMALYIVCNACLVHCIPPDKFWELLCKCLSENEISDKKIETMLIMVRDIIMCFTMCQKEGKYRDDKSMGKFVEDQPFSLAFRCGADDNVFDEDDCEGHDQHGCVHIKGLFKHIARDIRENGLDNIKKHIVLAASNCFCIQNEQTLTTLLKICIALGTMFENKQMDAIMSVGEANFASFSQVNAKGKVGKTHLKKDPHSFGLLLFKNSECTQIKGSMILETTGWENRQFGESCRDRHSPGSIDTMKKILSFSKEQTKPQNKFILRCIFNETMEDTLYLRIFAGDDCIFFTLTKDKGLQYGAMPSHIFKYTRIYQGESKQQVEAWLEENDGVVVLQVSPEQFLISLCNAESPWGKHNGAEKYVRDYHQVKMMYPDFHRCLMPPQITEAEFLRRINTYWGKITDNDIENIEYLKENEGLTDFENTLAISCRVEDYDSRKCSNEVQQFISDISKSVMIKEHDFMHSKIFILKTIHDNY